MKKRRIIRILLVVLSMVCGSMSASAQIKDGDIVTISQKEGDTYKYMTLTNNWPGLTYSTTPNVNCLWKVNKVGDNQFTFQSIADETLYLRGGQTYTGTNSSGTAFFYEENMLFFKRNGTTDIYVFLSGSYWYETSSKSYAKPLEIEKWELEGTGGGEVEGIFTPQTLNFGFVSTDQNITQTLTFTLKQGGGGGEGGNYYCVDRVDEVRIPAPTAAKISKNKRAIELKNIQFTWQNSGNNISKTRCSTLADSEVKEREMLELSWEKSTAEEDTWNLTVTAKGASPTNIVDANGDWIDYTDQIVATFTTEDETTHRVRANIRREAYHLQEWPTFEVTVSPTSYTYSKTGGPATFEVSCIHQNGADAIKSDGATNAGEIIRAAPVNVTNASTITFVAKSMLDETNVDWLTVESINNGEVTVSASDNSQNTTEREARLVGVITYTDPDDANDTHTETVVIPIKQRVKDGTITFLPQKGFSNT